MASMSEEELIDQVRSLEEDVSDLETERDQLKEDLAEMTNERDNLRKAIENAKEAAHTVWYDLGNA